MNTTTERCTENTTVFSALGEIAPFAESAPERLSLLGGLGASESLSMSLWTTVSF